MRTDLIPLILIPCKYPKKYMATAIWEAALFSYYVHVSSDLNFRVSGVDVYYDPESKQYLFQELYSNQIDEINEMSGCDPDEKFDLMRWHNFYMIVTELVKDIFGVDCNGHVRIRISDYASIDATTGEMCMNSRWRKKEEKPKQGLIKITDDENEEWY